MKNVIKISVLFILVVLASCKQENYVEIKGKVVGAKTKMLLLPRPEQNIRYDSIIGIDVVDGKFCDTIQIKYPIAVELIFKESLKNGRWSEMPLFLEKGKLDLTIYDEENFEKNIVRGGKLNAEYAKLKKELEERFRNKAKIIYKERANLQKEGKLYTELAKKTYEKYRKTKDFIKGKLVYEKYSKMINDRTGFTSEGKKIEEKLDAIRVGYFKFVHNYIENNPTIVAYYFFLRELKQKRRVDIAWAKKVQKNLSKANPNHPYNELSLNMINAIENIKVGKKFTDFTAPDLNGEKHTLSDEIKGKVALLDLWATWCGSCIVKSEMVRPIYEEYKDKGFKVVGVAGEFTNTKNLEKFLEKHKWEWLQLVELDRANKIWNKYGIDNAGGSTFLIDENGIIIAVNPTAKEIKKELEKRLK